MSVNVTLDHEQLCEATLGDPELMRDILAALIDDTSRQMGLLESAIHLEDPDQCKLLAHYAKGACANLGAQAAADVLREIERLANCGQFAACGRSLEALARELDRLREISTEF